MRRPGVVHLAVLLGYGALTVIMTWPLARHATSAIPGDGFDGWQNYWNLWWLRIALVDRLSNPFWTDILYAPTGVGLYFHTLNPMNGLITMPVQWTAGLIPAYNAVVLVSWVLAGYGTYLLCLWLLGSTGPGRARYSAAFVAGAIFTFAPFHMAHLLGHMQVMSLQWIPFYALYLLRSLSRHRDGGPWLRDAVLAGIFLVFNGLSDWYFVLYLFLFTGVTVVYYWLTSLLTARSNGSLTVAQGTRSLVRVLAPPFVSGLLFLLVLSPILLPMVREAMQFSFMVRPASDLYILSASAADYLIPSRLHTLWRDLGPALPGNQIAPVSERTIAVGYSVAALALAGVAYQRRRATFWLVAAFFFVLLSMGPALHTGNIGWDNVPMGGNAASWSPFGILNRFIPFMQISRSVSRYALMVQLSAAMLAGLGLSALLARMDRRAFAPLAAAALVVVLFEFWVAPYPLSAPDTPAFYTHLNADLNADLNPGPGRGTLLNLPMNYDRPGYLLYQTVHERPLAVAYISRDDPRTLTERVPLLQHFRHLGPDILNDDPVAVGLTVLNDMGVDTVVLDRYKMPGGEERTYTETLARKLFHGLAPAYEDERLTVYVVPPDGVPQPYLELGPLYWRPLQEDVQTGRLHRSIGDGPACFTVRRAPDGALVELRYYTEADGGATIVNDKGESILLLPPAPDGNIMTIETDLAETDLEVAGSRETDSEAPGLTEANLDPTSDMEFCIIADVPESVHVAGIRLRQP